MVFNSYIFILLFLPVSLIGYFVLNKYGSEKQGQAGLVWLLGVSLLFYAYDIPAFLWLFAASIVVNFLFGKGFMYLKMQKENTEKLQKVLLTAGILLNLVPLVYFKYSGFIADSIEGFFHAEWNVEVPLPLGISFFTFLQIAYLVDCYREEHGFKDSFLEYATYVAFFPKITMGPIVLHSEIVPQLRDGEKRCVNYQNLSCGLYIFALGLAKKVLIADVLAKFVNIGYADVHGLNSGTIFFVMLSYTLQLYFDFSGYCDMAVGIAKMFNIDLPYNFNSPYKARSISEFWDRWHMTLTRFFTKYVYIPLGGSRKGKLRTYTNTMIVFLLSGLWHGADWSFVLWGLLHGVLMIVEKVGKELGFGLKELSRNLQRIVDVVRWIVTFALINITWVFFRADSVKTAVYFLQGMDDGGWPLKESMIEVFDKLVEVRILKRFGMSAVLEANTTLTMWIILLVLVMAVVFLKNAKEKMMEEKYNWKRSLVTVILIVWSVVSLSEVSEFLYFNF